MNNTTTNVAELFAKANAASDLTINHMASNSAEGLPIRDAILTSLFGCAVANIENALTSVVEMIHASGNLDVVKRLLLKDIVKLKQVYEHPLGLEGAMSLFEADAKVAGMKIVDDADWEDREDDEEEE